MKKLAWIVGVGTLIALLFVDCTFNQFKPTFYTPHGIAVILEDGIELTPKEIDTTVFFYCKEIVKCAYWHDLSEEEIFDLMTHLVAKFQLDLIQHEICKYWCMGLQQYNVVKVVWKGGFSSCSFFHELNHVVEYFILQEVDYDHSNTEWWKCISSMKLKWKEEYEKEIL